jgi:hypothetical protein
MAWRLLVWRAMTYVERVVSPMMRMVTVNLSEFSVSALAAEGPRATADVPTRVVRAIRFYLNDRDSGHPGWAFPPQSRNGGESGGERMELELSVDEALWEQFEGEAGRQEVSISQLAGHAALYYAAELDAGRVAQRLLDSIEEDDRDPEEG